MSMMVLFQLVAVNGVLLGNLPPLPPTANLTVNASAPKPNVLIFLIDDVGNARIFFCVVLKHELLLKKQLTKSPLVRNSVSLSLTHFTDGIQ